MSRPCQNTGLLKMIVGVLTTWHTQYTWDRSICIFFYLIEQDSQVFVTYLTGALFVHPLWFYKHQHDNRVCSKLFVACQRWWFQWRFAAVLVNCAPSGEILNYCTTHIIKENSENFLIQRCNYILLSQVYCVWQVVKIPTIIFSNPVLQESLNLFCMRSDFTVCRLNSVRNIKIFRHWFGFIAASFCEVSASSLDPVAR
jgi:hypothetical protein